MATSNPLRAGIRRAGRKAVGRLPPPARLRLRQVKRAALGQPPVPPKRKPAVPKSKQTAAPKPAPARPGGPGPVRSVPGSTRLEVRRDNIFATAVRGGRALEIGPAHNAILPKREGFDARSVDYLDRAGLVDKYKHHTNYSPDDIEEVDYVLPPGAAMGEVIADRFDLVLASHVIEHTTSLIDFVNECGRLLAPAGVLALVVPDHRFCVDRFRDRTSLGTIIDASLAPPPVHTTGTLTEFLLNAARHGDTTAWTPGHRGAYSFVHEIEFAQRKVEQGRSGVYIDAHNWVFSPNHLRLLLADLADLGYIGLREAHFADTVGHEFFLNLTAESHGSGLTREELVSRADEERRELDVLAWGARA